MSNVVMTRVDARLIHGQVAVRWTKVLQAKKIVVVDNKSAADDFLTELLLLAAPQGVTVQVMNEAKALEEWNQCLNDNLTGQFLMSREFARRVIPAKRKGWIVNILSKASCTSTTKGRVCYVCNKSGETGLTHSLAVDLTEYGIHVNGVMPGFVMANTLKTQYETNRTEFNQRVERVPLKRVGEPWEIGTMVAFLASDKCELAVGTCVDMTGGLLLGY